MWLVLLKISKTVLQASSIWSLCWNFLLDLDARAKFR